MLSKSVKKEKGITLVALAVTIIVLIILASIGINLAFSDNGIIKEAQNAKESAEIDEEQGILKRAVNISLIKSKGANVEQSTLENALNDEIGEGKTEVSNVGEHFEVMFTETNRYYEVDENGKIGEVQYFVKEEYAGDITKGGRCDGSKEKPYEISCIEDLVNLSMIVGKYTNFDIKENNLKGKYIILTRTLNFNSKFSYNDSTSTQYGDYNEDGIVDDIKTELTKVGKDCKGFIPIGKGNNSEYLFAGTFNGLNNAIKNIYINSEIHAGLFYRVSNATICNLNISGNINGTGDTGAICGQSWDYSIIYNCINYAHVKGKYTGGICGVGYNAIIKNCINEGVIETVYNYYAGGMLGWSWYQSCNIYNCYNKGKISSGSGSAGGILGQSNYNNSTKIINCYNVGSVKGSNNGSGLICGYGDGLTILNTYYENVANMKAVGSEGEVSYNNCVGYEAEQMKSKMLVDNLNNYIESNTDETIDTSTWKRWKIGKDGYPTFDD